jgi:prepilin-type N-terminal cleavage/methylation domain-containing protein
MVRRNAFTLLELMLVLTIILAIGAIAVPRFTDVFDRQRLVASAETLRLAFDRARLEAMRTGQSQMFECTLATGQYSIHPLAQNSDLSDSGAGATVVTPFGTAVETQADGMLMAAAPTSLSGDVKELEEKIVFMNCIVATDMRTYQIAEESQATTGQLTTTTMGQAIIFYPDGSTSNAEVRLQNARGDMRAIRLRGLTGNSKVFALPGLAETIAPATGQN